MDMGKDIKVIFHAIDPVQVAIVVFQNPPNIFEQDISLVYLKARGSVFGTEDDVIENLCVGAHDQIYYKMYLRSSDSFLYLYEPKTMNFLQSFGEILQINAVILNPIRGSSLPDHFNPALLCGAFHVYP
jgi:hypothetical protein